MYECDEIIDWTRADREYRDILSAFAERKQYRSKHFAPHRFDVIGVANDTRLEFEMSPSRERVTLAEWDGAKLSFLPHLRQEVVSPDWAVDMLDHGLMLDGSVLKDVVELLLRSNHGLDEVDGELHEVLIPEIDDSRHPHYRFRWLYEASPRREDIIDSRAIKAPDKLRYYYCTFPYILDIKLVRIVRPNIVELFKRTRSFWRKRFAFEILDTLSRRFPHAYTIPEQVQNSLIRMKMTVRLDKATGQF